MAYKIILNRESCIGCGACAALCPKFFKIAEDGKSTIITGKGGAKQELEIQELGCAKTAAESCPVKAIAVKPKTSRKG